jgi:hypothetical protein
MLNESDYERIALLWRYALWPYNAPDPDGAGQNYLSALRQLQVGLLRVNILQSDVSLEDIARSATFSFEIIAPAEFHFDPAFESKATSCPPTAD